MMVLVTSQTCN